MKIVITGSPKRGKTTLVKSLLPYIDATGFYTQEIKRGGKRYGFDIITTWGDIYPLARVGRQSPFSIGKYAVFPQNLNHVIHRIMQSPLEYFIVIDEVGKMELLNPLFEETVAHLWQEHTKIIATIPIKDVHAIVKHIRKTADNIINLDIEKPSIDKLLDMLNHS